MGEVIRACGRVPPCRRSDAIEVREGTTLLRNLQTREASRIKGPAIYSTVVRPSQKLREIGPGVHGNVAFDDALASSWATIQERPWKPPARLLSSYEPFLAPSVATQEPARGRTPKQLAAASPLSPSGRHIASPAGQSQGS